MDEKMGGAEVMLDELGLSNGPLYEHMVIEGRECRGEGREGREEGRWALLGSAMSSTLSCPTTMCRSSLIPASSPRMPRCTSTSRGRPERQTIRSVELPQIHPSLLGASSLLACPVDV